MTSSAKSLAIWELSVPARCVLIDRNPGLELQLHVGGAVTRSHLCADPAMAHALAARWWAEYAPERRAHPRVVVGSV